MVFPDPAVQLGCGIANRVSVNISMAWKTFETTGSAQYPMTSAISVQGRVASVLWDR